MTDRHKPRRDYMRRLMWAKRHVDNKGWIVERLKDGVWEPCQREPSLDKRDALIYMAMLATTHDERHRIVPA